MITIEAWTNQILQIGAFDKRVKGCASLAVASDRAQNTPSAWVFHLGETSSPNPAGVNATIQRVTQRVGVLLAVANHRDEIGEDGLSELERARVALLNGLVGKLLSGADDQVLHASGDMQQYNDSTLWWLDQFTATYMRRSI